MQLAEAPFRAVLKMKRKNRKRLYMLLGVLMYVYYNSISTKFGNASQGIVKIISFVIQQIRVVKPKSKRLQYLLLLATAFIVKYLTRVDVFPDDLDRQIAGQLSSHVGPKQFFELTLNRAKARLIDDRQRVS